MHLLAGLEEVIDHVSSLGLDHWPESEPSCVFFTGWCHALRNVFDEHGLTLSRRPWEIHFLDLQTSFSHIGQLYKQFGDTSRRDTTLRIDGYKSPRLCRPKAEAHTQLQQDMQGGPSYEKSIFFMHDERRRLYLWGDTFIDLSDVRLYVQNATTGQRLPPAVNYHGETSRQGLVSSYGLSPSGEYVVVVYSIKAKNSRGFLDLYLTMVWQLSEELTFKRRMRSEPWARIVFSHQCEIKQFLTTNINVVFTDSDHCLTPSGEIYLTSGSRRPLPDRLSNRSVSEESTILGSFYSQNGKYLFMSEVTYSVDRIHRAIKVALFTETSDHLCSWEDSSRRRLDGVSPSGRYLLLSPDFTSMMGEGFLHLYDVDTSETIELPFVERIDYGEAKFQFVKDEMELIVFIPSFFVGIFMMTVLVWSDLQSNPSLKSYGRFKADSIIGPSQIHVNKNESSALMVSGSRVIQRVELRTQVKSPDAPDVDDDCPYTVSQVSKDGGRWALLRYGQNRAQLQMKDLSSARDPIRKLDLELSPYDELQNRTAIFSPDLSILVIDAQVFNISEEAHELTSASFTIQGLPELLVRYRTNWSPRFSSLLRCLISPCKSCIIYISKGDPFVREAAPAIPSTGFV